MLKELFEKLKNTNSVKDKEEILALYEDQENLQKLLMYGLDPYKLFHLNKIPKYSPNPNGETSLKEFFTLCDKLNNRDIVGNEAKEEVKKFLETCHSDHSDIFAKIISKASLGVGAKTVNKVWPKLIPEFGIMLAPNKIADATKIHYPCAVQPKLDGYRCVYKDGKMWSRAGKPFSNKNLMEYFKKLESVEDFVLDGELYLHGISFNKLTQILNSEEEAIPENLKYYVYDCVRNDYWEEQKKTPTYEARLARMRTIINDNICEYSKIIDVATDICEDPGQVMANYKNYLSKGYEGVMLKNLNGEYKWKRTTLKSGEMLKLKPYSTLDLEIKNVYPGEKGFEGIAGGLVVDHEGKEVKVGTGYNMELREKMFKAPQEYIGKIAEIRYFEKTKDNSLRHPSFVRFRPEKD